MHEFTEILIPALLTDFKNFCGVFSFQQTVSCIFEVIDFPLSSVNWSIINFAICRVSSFD